jgi:nucleoside-diphosphate-sugar epimerase
MRILISGSHGFVGRHFCKYFLDRDHKVVAIDNMVAGRPHEAWMFQPNDKTHFAQLFCDLRSFMATRPSREWGPQSFDLIIHCAAVIGGRLKIEEDPLAVATDLSIDAEFFNWVVRAKPMPKVIYFSSSAIYPLEWQTKQKQHLFLHEAMVHFNGATFGVPDMTYGFAKLAGEYLAKFAAEKYGLNVKVYRPFGGYGEDQDLTYPFPSIIKRVTDGHDPVLVWGSGDQQRDFIHIDDVVDAVITTMDKLAPGEPLNLGSGKATSFFELAEQAVYLAGTGASVINDPRKPEGVFSRVADATKLSQWWKPKISLAEGIQRALDRAKVKV